MVHASTPPAPLRDLALTALAPAIWGSSYIVTTTFLPDQHPMLVALLRALPAGVLLLLWTRQLPPLNWVPKLLVLGALNFSIFWALLFLSAYRLPGGVAATLGAIQPLLVMTLSTVLLNSKMQARSLTAALLSIIGIGCLVLGPDAALDKIGVLAGLGGALSMALGVVLTRKWQPPVAPLVFTCWQLLAGGILLLPVTAWALPSWPELNAQNLVGLAYMSLIGGALTYVLWFRGIARFNPAQVSILGAFSPLTAVSLGVLLLGEHLSLLQSFGAALTLLCVWLAQIPAPAPKARTA